MATYPRKGHYEHFIKMECYYSITVSIDITTLQIEARNRGNLHIYSALVWVLTTAANCIREFRMSFDFRLPLENNYLGYWDSLNPVYTVMAKDTRTFSTIWTEYNSDFPTFYHSSVENIENYVNGEYLPQGTLPGNAINISVIPWLEFLACHLNMKNNYLLPILTIGKFMRRSNKITMPLAIQVHHAVCDGYHV
jgi:chloramphenicol O-acetyltransferase type A